jgi:hypothetical protein
MVAISVTAANASGTACGVRRERETTRSPTTAGPMPAIAARLQGRFRPRSNIGRSVSMITNAGRKAARLPTSAPGSPIALKPT